MVAYGRAPFLMAVEPGFHARHEHAAGGIADDSLRQWRNQTARAGIPNRNQPTPERRPARWQNDQLDLLRSGFLQNLLGRLADANMEKGRGDRVDKFAGQPRQIPASLEHKFL